MLTNNYRIQQELKRLEAACSRYGFTVYEQFGTFHIRTRFESWYFEPRTNGTIRLMHCDPRIRKGNEWHQQFSRKMTYEQLARYIHEHETAKYTGRFVPFTFTKTGAVKAAVM